MAKRVEGPEQREIRVLLRAKGYGDMSTVDALNAVVAKASAALKELGMIDGQGAVFFEEDVSADLNRVADVVPLDSDEDLKAALDTSDPTPAATSDYPKPTGGGWYLLSNGEKVQGKAAATEAEAAL